MPRWLRGPNQRVQRSQECAGSWSAHQDRKSLIEHQTTPSTKSHKSLDQAARDSGRGGKSALGQFPRPKKGGTKANREANLAQPLAQRKSQLAKASPNQRPVNQLTAHSQLPAVPRNDRTREYFRPTCCFSPPRRIFTSRGQLLNPHSKVSLGLQVSPTKLRAARTLGASNSLAFPGRIASCRRVPLCVSIIVCGVRG